MKLSIAIPSSWTQTAGADGTVYVAPEGDLAVVVTPLFPAVSQPSSWMRRALSLSGEEVGRASMIKTRDGWKVSLLESPATALAAYVHVLDYAGGVIAHCSNENARPSWRSEVRTLIELLRPDFTQDEAVCLSHQLDGMVDGVAGVAS
jgi:hypothetical protein